MVTINNSTLAAPTVSINQTNGEVTHTRFRCTVTDSLGGSVNRIFNAVLKCEVPQLETYVFKKRLTTFDTNSGLQYAWTLDMSFDATDQADWIATYYYPLYVARYGPTNINDIVGYSSSELKTDINVYDTQAIWGYNRHIPMMIRGTDPGVTEPADTTGVLTFFDAAGSVIGSANVTIVTGTPRSINEQF